MRFASRDCQGLRRGVGKKGAAGKKKAKGKAAQRSAVKLNDDAASTEDTFAFCLSPFAFTPMVAVNTAHAVGVTYYQWDVNTSVGSEPTLYRIKQATPAAVAAATVPCTSRPCHAPSTARRRRACWCARCMRWTERAHG